MQYCAILYAFNPNTGYNAEQCNTMQYYTIQCNTMQHHAIQCNAYSASKVRTRLEAYILQAPFVFEGRVIFFSPSKLGPRGMFSWRVAQFGPPRTPQTRSLKYKMYQCVHMRGRKVTLITEWVIAPSVGDVLPLTDLKNLVPFPRYGHLKSSKGPPQILHCNFWWC